MSRWVVKIEENPTAFDPSPWLNCQGDIYMEQEVLWYQVVNEQEGGLKKSKWNESQPICSTAGKEDPPQLGRSEICTSSFHSIGNGGGWDS